MGTCHSSFLEVSQLQLCTPTKVSEPVKRRDEHTSAATRRVFDFVTERAHYRSVLCLAVSPLKTCPDTGHKLLYIYIYIYLIPSINHPSNLPLFRPIFSCSNKPRPENHFPFHLHSNIYIYSKKTRYIVYKMERSMRKCGPFNYQSKIRTNTQRNILDLATNVIKLRSTSFTYRSTQSHT